MEFTVKYTVEDYYIATTAGRQFSNTKWGKRVFGLLWVILLIIAFFKSWGVASISLILFGLIFTYLPQWCFDNPVAAIVFHLFNWAFSPVLFNIDETNIVEKSRFFVYNTKWKNINNIYLINETLILERKIKYIPFIRITSIFPKRCVNEDDWNILLDYAKPYSASQIRVKKPGLFIKWLAIGILTLFLDINIFLVYALITTYVKYDYSNAVPVFILLLTLIVVPYASIRLKLSRNTVQHNINFLFLNCLLAFILLFAIGSLA